MKIVLIGAGSSAFSKKLVADLLMMNDIGLSEIAMVDLDEKRLAVAQKMGTHMAGKLGKSVPVTPYRQRKKALMDADFVILAFQVGGSKLNTQMDFEIPKKHGLRQIFGDTLGVGGIMRALRTFPELFEICSEMEEICPDAVLINYMNPVAILGHAVQIEFPGLKAVGLCGSVRDAARQVALDLNISFDSLHYQCAGIHHMSFFLVLEKKLKNGQRKNLYQDLYRLAESGSFSKKDAVRYDMLLKFGFFATGSGEHLAEYVPWYLKGNRKEGSQAVFSPKESGLALIGKQTEEWKKDKAALENDNFRMPEKRNETSASEVVEAIVTGKPAVINGNVLNEKLIDNLPEECCVEVPCLIDGNGIQPVMMGTLPPQLIALMNTNINVQRLTVEAYMTGKVEHIYHAAYMDPLISAELDLDQITALVDDLIEVHADRLPIFEF